MFKFLRSTLLVIVLLVSLAALAASATIWAITQTQNAIEMSAKLASSAVRAMQHQNEVLALKSQHKRQLMRQKAAGRLKRIVVAVPVVGFVAAGYFEEKDRRSWLADNPGKTNSDYACELAEISAEVADDVLAGLPVDIQLPDWAIPTCDS
ncbi:hypothetical protein [Pseudorhodobacter aquimaris]|uniref:hypothetical protein n=1 Tax=Pseudorhodobacter aquimaris TaxID=687412 RepID=UPI00067E01A7|nr:hypothetical protein [Pseudorhodobacter aquimaris]